LVLVEAVLMTIDLDDKMRSAALKIHNVRREWRLAAEMVAY